MKPIDDLKRERAAPFLAAYDQLVAGTMPAYFAGPRHPPRLASVPLRCICGHSQYHHDMAGISAAPESCCECGCAKWRMDDSGGAP